MVHGAWSSAGVIKTRCVTKRSVVVAATPLGPVAEIISIMPCEGEIFFTLRQF
jgi:hypothetical protein